MADFKLSPELAFADNYIDPQRGKATVNQIEFNPPADVHTYLKLASQYLNMPTLPTIAYVIKFKNGRDARPYTDQRVKEAAAFFCRIKGLL